MATTIRDATDADLPAVVRLVNALVARAAAAGKRVVAAAIDGENVESVRFHERLGFVQVGRLPGVGEKFGRRLDLVLMQRDVV